MKELKDVGINDNFLFGEVQKVNMYFNEKNAEKMDKGKSKRG